MTALLFAVDYTCMFQCLYSLDDELRMKQEQVYHGKTDELTSTYHFCDVV